jgi:hypothetical protein
MAGGGAADSESRPVLAFVGPTGDATLQVRDLDTGSAVSWVRITLDHATRIQLAGDESGRWVAALCPEDGRLCVVDLGESRQVTSTTLPSRPGELGIAGETILLTGSGSRAVSLLDRSTLEPRGELVLPDIPGALAIDRQTGHACIGLASSAALVFVDPARRTIHRIVLDVVVGGVRAIASTPGGRTLMVLNHAGVLQALSVHDDLATQAELHAGGFPSQLAVSAAGSGVALRAHIGPLQVIQVIPQLIAWRGLRQASSPRPGALKIESRLDPVPEVLI